MNELLITNGKILTMGPQGTVENGQVLIRDGKIAAVGQGLDAGDAKVLEEYCDYLESYLDGGFVQGKAAEIQRHQLEQLLKKRLDALGRRSYTLECKLAAAQLALAEYDRAEATLDALTARWPQRETPWLLHLRMAAALRDGAAIQKTLHDIEEKEVYLSAKGRETVRFWQGKNA